MAVGNLDDTPKVYFTKEEIEQIVEDKVYEILELKRLEELVIDDEFVDNIKEAGKAHTKKKKDSRAILKICNDLKELNEYLHANKDKLPLESITIDEQEDGTYIVY